MICSGHLEITKGYVNRQDVLIACKTPAEELKALDAVQVFVRMVHPDDHKNVENFMLAFDPTGPKEIGATIEYRVKYPALGYRWVSTSRTVLFNKETEKIIGMMELNPDKIVSPFLRKLSSKFLGLTPTEIQVSDLIRHGKTTKEIADMLNLSYRIVEFHRVNIRRKIGIKNKKASLMSHLMSFD